MSLVAGAAVLGSATAASAATSYAVIATVPLGASGAADMAIDPGNNSLYVSHIGANLVSVIDLTSNTVTDTIPLASPGRMAVDPVAHRAYIITGGTVKVIDTTSNSVVDTIAGFGFPIGIAVDPGTHRVYVSNFLSNVVSVIDTTTSPATITNTGFAGNAPWAMAVDPSTHRAYATTLVGGTVSVVSGTSVVNSVDGFLGPINITVDPSTQHAYVINNDSDNVSVIDTNTDTIAGTFTAGSSPSDLAVDPGTHTAFVANLDADTVSVIDQASNAVVGTVPVSDFPVDVEVDPLTHRVYVSHNDNTVSVIAPFASQEITFTSAVPTLASVGGSHTITATGGGSGNPVAFSTVSPACTVTSGGQVAFTHVGDCVISANQAGNGGHTAAPTATRQLGVSLEQTTTGVTLPTSGVVFGQAATATVAVSSTHDGSVQFTLDTAPVGNPVLLDPAGAATSPDLVGPGLAVGSHQVGAVFTPTDTNRYAGSSATPQSLTVSQAATTSSVAVGANAVSATVTPTAPGAGVPTGTVQFYLAGRQIGSAGLTDRTATLAYRVPAGRTRQVSTVYAGDAAFTGSSASKARRDPVISATVSSAKAPHKGWYASPVKVTFTCRRTSAALTGACPARVRLPRSGAGQSVTRTIMATDGGAATVVVSGINIDTVRPAVRVTGVRAGATYFATGPVAGCRATDRLSGVATCTVTRTTRGHRVAYVAIATDRAGNRSSTRLVARTTSVAISGASMKGGHYVVHRGRTYTVLVAAAKRPSYVYATPSPLRPAGGSIPFKRVGKNQWALGVVFTQSMSHHTWWNIGTRVGSHTTVTTVRVVR